MITHFLDLAFHNAWTFWGAVLIMMFVLATISVILSTIDYAIKQICRTMRIRKNGWPPPHCDADGEEIFREKE